MAWKKSVPLAVLLLTVSLWGCGQNAPPAPPAGASSQNACAGRLQDLCEPLLVFNLKHHRLPNDLEEFKAADGHVPPLVCPASGRPYVWQPDGPLLAGQTRWVVLADSQPSHDGKRWAILAEEGAAGQMTLRVSLLLPPGAKAAEQPGAAPRRHRR
jgi:hypothetical protein